MEWTTSKVNLEGKYFNNNKIVKEERKRNTSKMKNVCMCVCDWLPLLSRKGNQNSKNQCTDFPVFFPMKFFHNVFIVSM